MTQPAPPHLVNPPLPPAVPTQQQYHQQTSQYFLDQGLPNNNNNNNNNGDSAYNTTFPNIHIQNFIENAQQSTMTPSYPRPRPIGQDASGIENNKNDCDDNGNNQLGRLTNTEKENCTCPARIKYTSPASTTLPDKVTTGMDNVSDITPNNSYFDVQPYHRQRSSIASNSSAVDSRTLSESRKKRTSQSGLPDELSSPVPPSGSTNFMNYVNSNSVVLPSSSNAINQSASTIPFILNAQHPSPLHRSSTNAKIRHSDPKFRTQPIDYTQTKGEPKIIFLNI